MIIFGLIFVLAVLFLIFLGIKELISNHIEKKKEKLIIDYLLGDLHDMVRWCSYDFPVSEGICYRYINYIIEGHMPEDMQSFRGLLRRKYQKQNEIVR